MKTRIFTLAWCGAAFLASTASAQQSLAADAAALAAKPGTWRSDVMDVKVRDGTTQSRVLGVEFGANARAAQAKEPAAQAKLFTGTPATGVARVAEASSTLGDANFRDVFLQEKDGVRTITFRRALPADEPEPAKKKRIYDRFWSVSFRYELKGDLLTLKGFPTADPVNWGVSAFIVPKEDITFKAAR